MKITEGVTHRRRDCKSSKVLQMVLGRSLHEERGPLEEELVSGNVQNMFAPKEPPSLYRTKNSLPCCNRIFPSPGRVVYISKNHTVTRTSNDARNPIHIYIQRTSYAKRARHTHESWHTIPRPLGISIWRKAQLVIRCKYPVVSDKRVTDKLVTDKSVTNRRVTVKRATVKRVCFV